MAGMTEVLLCAESPHPDAVSDIGMEGGGDGGRVGGVVSTSPQGKGVGVFAMSGSPGSKNGLKVTGGVHKDPKVCY